MDLKQFVEDNKLYKYQSLNINTLTNLINNQLWFSNPMKLNDPLEGKIPFQLNEPDEEEWLEIHEKIIQNKYPDFPIPVKNNKAEPNDEPNDEQKRMIRFVAKHELSDLLEQTENVVACFSRLPNIYLLWSHYADGHRGFCMQFNKEDSFFSRAESIDYKEKFQYFDIDNIFSGKIPEINKTIKSKMHWWEYERELRIIEKGNPGPIKFNKNALTGVICGVNMTNNDVRLLFSVVSNYYPNTKVYRMSHECDYDGVFFGLLKRDKIFLSFLSDYHMKFV